MCKFKQFLLSILLFVCSLTFVTQLSFSYFDNLSSHDEIDVNIGKWINLNFPVNADDIVEYCEEHHIELSDYLLNIIGTFNNENKDLLLDNIFNDYTNGNLIETVELINDFTNHFLKTNADGDPILDKDGNPEFLPANQVEPIQLIPNMNLMPGEHFIFNEIIQTAQYTNTTWWSTLTLEISIESEHGEDISDYAIEVLFDKQVFNENNPFAYNYRLVDKISYNDTRADGSVKENKNNLINVVDNVEFKTEVYKNINKKYISTLYSHIYNKPNFPGNWTRLPFGPNYYISEPRQSDQGLQQQFISRNTRQGMILMGKPNGSKVDLRIHLSDRNPRYEDGMPLIPISLVLTRGLQLDNKGKPLPNQSTIEVNPIIKIKVLNSDVWY